MFAAPATYRQKARSSKSLRGRRPHERIDGGGASEIGPDLGQPMAATDYMTEPGLRALVRDPKSVRTWPQQQMPAFPPNLLPDTELNALIADLKEIASQRGR